MTSALGLIDVPKRSDESESSYVSIVLDCLNSAFDLTNVGRGRMTPKSHSVSIVLVLRLLFYEHVVIFAFHFLTPSIGTERVKLSFLLP